MIVKPYESSDATIARLESLLTRAKSGQRKHIETEIRNIRAGDRAEKDSAYHIDFHYGDSTKDWAVLHDLRLEVNGRVAQIDHLLINRFLDVYVLESKNFHAGFKVTDGGEFVRWNQYAKRYEPMNSPIEQNVRHIAVLSDAWKILAFAPSSPSPLMSSVVLISANARFIRAKVKPYSDWVVLRADQLRPHISAKQPGLLGTLLMPRISSEQLRSLGEELLKLHTPMEIDYEKRFVIISAEAEDKNTATAGPEEPHAADDRDEPKALETSPPIETLPPSNGSDAPPAEAPIADCEAAPAAADMATDESTKPEVEGGEEQPAGQCDGCGTGVNKKVVNFCRLFNKRRFGGKVYCRSCQENLKAEI